MIRELNLWPDFEVHLCGFVVGACCSPEAISQVVSFWPELAQFPCMSLKTTFGCKLQCRCHERITWFSEASQ